MKALKKVNAEIAKVQAQLDSLQERLQYLIEQRTQLENAEMVAAIRNAQFDANEMLAVIAALKQGGKELSSLLPNSETMEQEEPEHENYETL